MNNDRQRIGQAAALVTILIWGTTFISTKVLLDTLSPVEILFLRFSLGYLALWLAAPRLAAGRLIRIGRTVRRYFILWI